MPNKEYQMGSYDTESRSMNLTTETDNCLHESTGFIKMNKIRISYSE